MACVYYFYKIYCKDSSITDIYVGSHKDRSGRKSNHRNTCNNPNDRNHHLKVYKCIREHGGWDNWIFEHIHNQYCENTTAARIIEQRFMDKMKPTLNSCRAYTAPTGPPTKNKIREYLKDLKRRGIKHIVII